MLIEVVDLVVITRSALVSVVNIVWNLTNITIISLVFQMQREQLQEVTGACDQLGVKSVPYSSVPCVGVETNVAWANNEFVFRARRSRDKEKDRKIVQTLRTLSDRYLLCETMSEVISVFCVINTFSKALFFAVLCATACKIRKIGFFFFTLCIS